MTNYIDETKKDCKIRKQSIFNYWIDADGTMQKCTTLTATTFDIIKLIRRRDDTYKFDLFVAYNFHEEHECETWYLGQAGDEFE